jgi:hypothetical protein
MASGDALGDLLTRSTLRLLPQGTRSRSYEEKKTTLRHRGPSGPELGPFGLPQGRRHFCRQVADRPTQSRGPSVPPRRALLGDSTTCRRLPPLFTSRSRTQGIAHHEKALGFVTIWSRIGGDHHICVAPHSGYPLYLTIHHLKVISTAIQFIIVFGDQKDANTLFGDSAGDKKSDLSNLIH